MNYQKEKKKMFDYEFSAQQLPYISKWSIYFENFHSNYYTFKFV